MVTGSNVDYSSMCVCIGKLMGLWGWGLCERGWGTIIAKYFAPDTAGDGAAGSTLSIIIDQILSNLL